MTETVYITTDVQSKSGYGWMGYECPRRDYGWIKNAGNQAQSGTVTVNKEKRSVNDGEFVPGTYRVNPYSIKGGKIMVSEKDSEQMQYKLGENPIPVPQIYLNLMAEGAPVWVMRYPWIYTGYSYGGVVKGQTLYDTMWLSGEWWRYQFATQATNMVTPHEAADYEQLSLQKAYGKLLAADLDLGESLGEYKETIQMLRHPLSELKKFLLDDRSRNLRLLKALAKKDKRQINRLLGRTGLATADTISGTWLELRYGLRPLISLVQDVIDRVKDKNVEILDPTRIRAARSKLTFGPIKTWVDVYDWYPTQWMAARGRVLVEDTYTSYASVQYLQKEEQSFLDTLGLTPRFLPEVAWELTRLSFVVDWLFSIGPWLATLRINPGIEVLGNTTGFKHQRSVELHTAQFGLVHYGYRYEQLPNTLPRPEMCFETESYVREVDLDLSYKPHFTWGRTLDLFKAIDSVTLIWQNLKFLLKQ